ncbi:putative T6SS immunity periplasmic lipoprotein [Pantoea sp. BAV 3049]|uniref:putative T6SS immunity periplasmic lipoprotein n=1 Tax=Pantoea sp. BAV 3049 TaxID=2654188 RepID=UPI00131B82E1|nr:putative T6SS immunity periplasmic lipoprotein [Pantoea sp. BAV 3049]
MKISTALVIMLLLSGCELNDPRPKVYPAQVSLINNNVCMSVPAEKGEFIVSLNIESQEKEKSLRKHFTDGSHPVYILPEQCIPLYGYQFEADRPYGLSIQLEKRTD